MCSTGGHSRRDEAFDLAETAGNFPLKATFPSEPTSVRHRAWHVLRLVKPASGANMAHFQRAH